MSAENTLVLKLMLSGQAQMEAGLRSITNSTKNVLTPLSGMLLPITGLLAGIGSTAGIAKAIHDVIELGGAMNDLQTRTGGSIGKLLIMRTALTDAGVGADRVGDVLDRVQQQIGAAATGSDSAAKSLTNLGLSAQGMLSMAPDDQFKAVADKISAIENPTLRTAAAMDVFGRSGGELMAFFNDPDGFKNATLALGKMPEILARNVPVLDSIGTALGHIPLKSQQFFTGVVDQLGEGFKKVTDLIDKIDLTPTGQKVGAFVNVAIEQWKAGRFGDFLSLTLEAGFETGFAKGREMFSKFIQLIANAPMASAIKQVVLITTQELTKGMGEVISYAFQGFSAGLIKVISETRHAFDVVAQQAKSVFAGVINFLAKHLETVMNGAAGLANKIPGVKLPQVALGRADERALSVEPALTLAQAWDQAGENADVFRGRMSSFFNEGIAATKQLYQLNTLLSGEIANQGTAMGRLNALIGAQLVARDAARANEKPKVPEVPLTDLGRYHQEQLLNSKKELQDLENQRFGIENSISMTAAEKYSARKKLLEQEKGILEGERDILQQRLDIENLTPDQQDKIKGDIINQEGKIGQTDNKLGQMGPDPNSITQTLEATFTSLVTRMGTVAEMIGNAFTNVIGSAISGIAGGIEGLIKGTMTWGSALQNIGSSILGGVISAISEMFATWLVKRALMASKEIFFSGIEAAAKLPGTIMTAISSNGVAVAIGMGALVAALAFSGGFKEGGYTGDGGVNDFAGIVHGREFVMPADATSRIGVGNLEALAKGAPMEPTTQASTGGHMAVAFFDDRSKMREWLETQEGKTAILDIVGKNRHVFM